MLCREPAGRPAAHAAHAAPPAGPQRRAARCAGPLDGRPRARHSGAATTFVLIFARRARSIPTASAHDLTEIHHE
ncbi:MAG: hypothetical protein DI549_20075 [Ancylobacter novellus]|uniref:Uncharacterized protein n=1 Tax=Ancylobacter novellus TaxID=921 RepID=A0A2W5QLF7_ANCNO|nr:MAG: hypothetical protein DI549_20075 [Ancylobacter novellus]